MLSLPPDASCRPLGDHFSPHTCTMQRSSCGSQGRSQQPFQPTLGLATTYYRVLSAGRTSCVCARSVEATWFGARKSWLMIDESRPPDETIHGRGFGDASDETRPVCPRIVRT